MAGRGDEVPLSEGSVRAWTEHITAVVFEADDAVKRRRRVRTRPVVTADLTGQCDPIPASAALFVVPPIEVTGLSCVAVPALDPALMAAGVVRPAVTGPTLIIRMHGVHLA
jgi:hypothetical protein